MSKYLKYKFQLSTKFHVKILNLLLTITNGPTNPKMGWIKSGKTSTWTCYSATIFLQMKKFQTDTMACHFCSKTYDFFLKKKSYEIILNDLNGINFCAN